MDGELINPNPVVHARRRTARRRSTAPSAHDKAFFDAGAFASEGDADALQAEAAQREPIDALEVFEHLRDVSDPEHPYSLEQLGVVEEAGIVVDDAAGSVR